MAVEIKKNGIVFRGMSKPTSFSVKSGHSEFQEKSGKKHFCLAKCSKSRKLKVETLSKELKAVLLKKNVFEARLGSSLSILKDFCRLDFKDFNAGLGLIISYPKKFLQEKRLSDCYLWWNESSL